MWPLSGREPRRPSANRMSRPSPLRRPDSQGPRPVRCAARKACFAYRRTDIARRANLSRQNAPPSIPIYRNYLDSSPKSGAHSAPSRPDPEGRTRRHERWCGMRWTWWFRRTGEAGADGKSVWSRSPDAGIKFFARGFAGSDGGYQARTPGRARHKP
jgi:hypothetical protein